MKKAIFETFGRRLEQIRLPLISDERAYPKLRFCEKEVSNGETFAAWLPTAEGRWKEITIGVNNKLPGVYGWAVITPGLEDVCPIGLWCSAPNIEKQE